MKKGIILSLAACLMLSANQSNTGDSWWNKTKNHLSRLGSSLSTISSQATSQQSITPELIEKYRFIGLNEPTSLAEDGIIQLTSNPGTFEDRDYYLAKLKYSTLDEVQERLKTERLSNVTNVTSAIDRRMHMLILAALETDPIALAIQSILNP